jgi:hypothetical protein
MKVRAPRNYREEANEISVNITHTSTHFSGCLLRVFLGGSRNGMYGGLTPIKEFL